MPSRCQGLFKSNVMGFLGFKGAENGLGFSAGEGLGLEGAENDMGFVAGNGLGL